MIICVWRKPVWPAFALEFQPDLIPMKSLAYLIHLHLTKPHLNPHLHNHALAPATMRIIRPRLGCPIVVRHGVSIHRCSGRGSHRSVLRRICFLHRRGNVSWRIATCREGTDLVVSPDSTNELHEDLVDVDTLFR